MTVSNSHVLSVQFGYCVKFTVDVPNAEETLVIPPDTCEINEL